jgi:rod shape-determining protein MreC
MLPFLRRNRVLIVSGAFLLVSASLILRTSGARVRTDWFGSLLLETLAPVQRVLVTVGQAMVNVWNGAGDLFTARREVVVLRERMRGLEQAAAQSGEVAVENQRLRRLLELREQIAGDLVTARVIGRDATGLSQTLLLDRGKSDGLVTGAAVVAPEGIVGQVFQLSPTVARVLLITDHNSGVDALVQRSRVRGIAEGNVDGGVALKFIKRTDDVQIGDKVVTSGLDGIFPKGFLIGEVTAINKRGQSMFQSVEVTPIVSFDRLEEALISRGTIGWAAIPGPFE